MNLTCNLTCIAYYSIDGTRPTHTYHVRPETAISNKRRHKQNDTRLLQVLQVLQQGTWTVTGRLWYIFIARDLSSELCWG